MFLCHYESIEYFGWDRISVDIDDFMVFTNAQISSIIAQRFQVCSYKSVRLLSNYSQIDIRIEFHIFSVNAENFHSSNFVRDSDVDFFVETSGSAQRLVD